MAYSDVKQFPQSQFNDDKFVEIDPWTAPEYVQEKIDNGHQLIAEVRNKEQKQYGTDLAAVGEILSDLGDKHSQGWRQVVTGVRIEAQRDFRTFKAETVEDLKELSRVLSKGSNSVRFYARR